MKASDYIFDYYYLKGIDTVFTVVGGGSMYLNDALTRSKMTVVCAHGEQAASYSAVGYSKLTNKPCICLVTSGCGSTNAITGLLSAYQDSVPVIFISGQVNRCDQSSGTNLRQKGIQEVDITSIVDVLCRDKEIKDMGGKCLFTEALNHTINVLNDNRKSPVWIDIPLDIQNMEV